MTLQSARFSFTCLLVLILPLSALAAGPSQVPDARTFPWVAKTTTELNLRKGPGTTYESLGVFDKDAVVVVDYRTLTGNWVKVSFNEKDKGPMEGFVDGTYLNYINQLNPPPPKKEPRSTGGFWRNAWKVLRAILITLVVFLILAFKDELATFFAPIAVFAGGGALLFWLGFNAGWLGAALGAFVGLMISVRVTFDVNGLFGTIVFVLMILYYIVSLPFYIMNRLQFILSEPWRYIFKRHYGNDNIRPTLRAILDVLKIILYVVLTPLRLVNAVYFNIVVHNLVSLYDLIMEVLVPCNMDEGKGNAWKWLVKLPWRIIRYPVFHGVVTLLESVAWTVIDVFIPAITLYHGTDLTAGQNIVGSRNRNRGLTWKSGTFLSSQGGWGGIGVYFASARWVAIRYANDPRRLSDTNPVIIVCRVSPGRVINYSLTPLSVYNSTGQYGNPPTLNRWAGKHNYTTGEWWNKYGGYWEFCLFDWQNLYNNRWRIRPIYIYNVRTRLFQHIKGGMAHWTFKF